MTNTTTALWHLPNTTIDALAHLVRHHGWAPDTSPDESLVQAHRFAHGIDGRPDLADTHLDHAHSAANSWPAPAGAPPVGGWSEPTGGTRQRPLTWVILGWNALMFAWIVYGLVATGGAMNDCATETYSDACAAGATIGGGFAIGMILFLTAIVDVILGVIWTVTKKD